MSNLNKIVVTDEAAAGEYVFSYIENLYANKQLNVIGLATGGTMLPVYAQWRQTKLDFSEVITFNLDEYIGLAADHHQSYAYFMKQQLFDHITFKKSYLLNGLADSLNQECCAYEAALGQYPLDLQLLGVGENGHIAFNEPGTSADSLTHIESLTPSTISANSRFFKEGEDVPDRALTMGIRSILNAKRIVIVILGDKKRNALKKLYAGVVDNAWPITHLLTHPEITVITDIKTY